MDRRVSRTGRSKESDRTISESEGVLLEPPFGGSVGDLEGFGRRRFAHRMRTERAVDGVLGLRVIVACPSRRRNKKRAILGHCFVDRQE